MDFKVIKKCSCGTAASVITLICECAFDCKRNWENVLSFDHHFRDQLVKAVGLNPGPGRAHAHSSVLSTPDTHDLINQLINSLFLN